MKNVQEKIEAFLEGKDVSILHLKFAVEVIQQFDGVWVLFLAPAVRTCRATVPKIAAFARKLKSSRSWIRVGTVNMAVDGNEALPHFGRASESIRRLVPVTVTSGAATSLDA